MSQLSGQSSASRKTPGGGNGTVGVNVNGNSGAGPDAVGLTAEEVIIPFLQFWFIIQQSNKPLKK